MAKTTISMTIEPEDLRLLDKLKGKQGRGQFIVFCVKKYANGYDSTESVGHERIGKLTDKIEELAKDIHYWRELSDVYKSIIDKNAKKTTELDRE